MEIIDKINEIKEKETVDFELTFDKESLFLLGVIFASGKRIKLLNRDKIQKTETKSFNNMSMYWEDNNLVPNVKDNYADNKIFLICPVNRATEEQKKTMMEYISETEQNGHEVHYPDRDTNQVDPIGYRICTDNANAIGNAKSVHIVYDRTSVGTLFDLGVAYYFMLENPNRDFKIVNKNDIALSDDDFGDKIIRDMETMTKKHQKIKVPQKLKKELDKYKHL